MAQNQKSYDNEFKAQAVTLGVFVSAYFKNTVFGNCHNFYGFLNGFRCLV